MHTYESAARIDVHWYYRLASMSLTIHCLDTLKPLEVPQLDGHVSRTGSCSGRNTLFFIYPATLPRSLPKADRNSITEKEQTYAALSVKINTNKNVLLTGQNEIHCMWLILFYWYKQFTCNPGYL